MRLKKIDNIFDFCLWAIFIMSIVGAWFLAKSISAPKFEVARYDIKFPYEYTNEDGSTKESVYYLAWRHDQFSKPKVVVYDPSTGESQTFKDEYVEEYKAQMPESKYAFWQRCFWVILIIFIVIAALITYFVGGYIRDAILYLITKRRYSFSDCAYFLYDDRMCFTNQVKKLLVLTIDRYIATKKAFLDRKYNPAFVELIMQILTEIKVQQDTRVRFYYSYLDNTKRYVDYLKDLSLYWQSQIGKDPNAEKNQEYIDTLRQKDYVDFKLKYTASDFVGTVSVKLKELFTEVMGEEVFNFEAYKSEYAEARKIPGAIFVTTTIENSLNTFTWSGNDYSGKVFPGIAVRFTIYHYKDGVKNVLWNRYLKPVCTYRAEDGSLDVSDLYNNMIRETINSFSESLKNNA